MSSTDSPRTPAQRIIPNIWCTRNATEVAEHIAGAFNEALPGSASWLISSTYPSEGLLPFQEELAKDPLTVDVQITGPFGDEFTITLINAGAEFSPNPSISLLVNGDPLMFGGDVAETRARLTQLWDALVADGTELMPLGPYPFSELYGWCEDRFGISWQLMLTDPEGDPRPFMMPSLLFGGKSQNKARQALEHYTTLLPDSHLGMHVPYEVNTGPATAGAAMFVEASLAGQWITAMDSGVEMESDFNNGVSLEITCDGQDELDHVWAQLSRVAEAEVCGWCEDEFGVSWQVTPMNMAELMDRPGAFSTLMNMKKIVISEF